LDLEVDQGTVVSVAGINGAGKTTLLRIVSGLVAADAGRVRVCGLELERDSTRYQRSIGLLAAGNSGLYGRLKVEHHLELALRLALVPKRLRGPAAAEATAMFDLAPLCGTRVDRLSMGQRQRVRLALAFVHRPQLILLDEPTNSLDERAAALLESAMLGLKSRGGSALLCVPSGSQQTPAVDLAYTLSAGRLTPQ
jgi:ABC-2 type transport system ATP-binding protein